MKPWEQLDKAPVPGGGELVLWRHDKDYVIRLDGAELMGSRAHASEDRLGARGCEHVTGVRGARVLIGGLGLGYTARASLDVLAPDAVLDIAELCPGVVEWNRGVLGPLAGSPLRDPRTRVLQGDVCDVIDAARGTYDAILLDVDNGPSAMTSPGNARLYSEKGVARAARALKKNGVLAVWSASDDARFSSRLRGAGFDPKKEHPRAASSGGRKHTLWIAQKVSDVTEAATKTKTKPESKGRRRG
jgi:spermidine synthase